MEVEDSKMSIPSKEELIEGWEYVLAHRTKSIGELENLIQTTVNVLRGNSETNRQKAINTWTRISVKEKLSSSMSRRIDATLYYLTR